MKKINVYLIAEAKISVLGSVVCEVPEEMPDEDVERALKDGVWTLTDLCDNFVVADEGGFSVEGNALLDEWHIAEDTDGTDVRMERDGTLTEAQNPLGE